MADKQIIIHNVDVSECTYSKIGIDKKCYCEQDLYDDGTPVFTCDECTNCYYKQLKRKEQECEELKKECERLKNELSTYGATGICETCTEKSVLKCDQLEKENEKMKKKLQAQRNFTAQEQRKIYCVAYDKTCETGNECKQKKCVFKDRLTYKQTLTEIKDMCSEMNCESLMQNSWCGNTDFKMGCCEKLFKKQILQKISECEVEDEK